MSTQGPGEEGRRRSGHPGGDPVGLSPQPSLDVQQSVGDVEPGVEVRDVIGAGSLQSCES